MWFFLLHQDAGEPRGVLCLQLNRGSSSSSGLILLELTLLFSPPTQITLSRCKQFLPVLEGLSTGILGIVGNQRMQTQTSHEVSHLLQNVSLIFSYWEDWNVSLDMAENKKNNRKYISVSEAVSWVCTNKIKFEFKNFPFSITAWISKPKGILYFCCNASQRSRCLLYFSTFCRLRTTTLKVFYWDVIWFGRGRLNVFFLLYK